MMLYEIAERTASGFEEYVRSLVRIDRKLIGRMSFVDHLSSYGASAFAVVIGHYFAKAGHVVLPMLLALAFMALMSINVIRGLVALSAMGTPRWVGAAAMLFLVLILPRFIIGIV